ncbi:MAG: DUF3014 domain-containing protein [Burkholderiales bacterium]
MKKSIIWSVLLLGIFGAIAANYYWRQQKALAPEPPPPAQASAPEEKPAVEPDKTEPAIRFPIEDIKSPDTAQRPITTLRLSESDPALREALSGLFDRKSIDTFFRPDEIARRIVATVDGLPRKTAAERTRPMVRTPGAFQTSGKDETLILDPDNFRRYGPVVKLTEAIDAKKLVALYVRYYAVFQEAYRELGYPSGYFNDRLVEAIDNLLAAPAVTGPIKLVQPKVMYQFEDPALEARSAGQKILIRMGPENMAKIKTKLRELRREVTGKEFPTN